MLAQLSVILFWKQIILMVTSYVANFI